MRPIFLAFLASALTLPAAADEGMWTFDAFPRDAVKRAYGFDLTDAWLDHVRLASLRFNPTGTGPGGSGSFVSARGLVMTNHHVGADCINKLGSAGSDLLRDGFYARTPDAEIKCPDLELDQLIEIRDVTREVQTAARPYLDDAAGNAAQKETMSALEKACVERTHGRCDVVTLYSGGRYDLYVYKKYTDVRLVFAPEAGVAFFGGDPDNFEFPRWDLDVAFFRVYENGAAVAPEYLRWSAGGARDGELVFVPGHPGRTERLDTAAKLEFIRDVIVPFQIERLGRARQALEAFGRLGAEQGREAANRLYNVMNLLKLNLGRQAGLKDERLFALKHADEAALRRSDPRLAAVLDKLDAVEKQRRATFTRYYFVELAHLGSQLMGYAEDLVRLVAEKEKPDGERLREYSDAARRSLELKLFSPAPVFEALDEAQLASMLEWMQSELGTADPYVKTALAGKTPAARAHELVAGTKLKDPAFRRKLAGDKQLVATTDDPMVALARALDAERRAVRKLRDDTVDAPERHNQEALARVLFAVRGKSLYPDATFTLRLSYGKIAGYVQDGAKIPATTTLAGLWERSAKAGGKEPYALPPRWLERRARVDGAVAMNVVSTNDIIGGNSGSPMINAKGEVVGLVFDGNIQSLIGDYIYDETQNRTISVCSEALIEVLRHVYDAGALADELQPPRGARP